MYNRITIIPGLVIFVIMVTLPVWINGFETGDLPKPDLPEGQCIAPASEMRDTHMSLLNEWRDDVLRNGNRVTVTVDEKEYRSQASLIVMPTSLIHNWENEIAKFTPNLKVFE